MTNQNIRNLLATSLVSAVLAGCGGDAKTIIIEREPIVETPNNPGSGSGGNNGNDFIIDSMGRLAVTSLASNRISLLDIDDGTLLDHFDMQHDGMRVAASADNRYAVLAARSFDTVEFLDGGLWREDHAEHLHDYEQAPSMSDFVLTGSRPTHISTYDGKLAVFYDGDSDAGVPASVQVVSDHDIESETTAPASLM